MAIGLVVFEKLIIELIVKNNCSLEGMQFAASENIVIPSSKAHFPVALLVDSAELDGAI